MKTLAIVLAIALIVGTSATQAGDIVKRDLGTGANGQLIEGYVFQADSRHRRSSSSSHRSFRPSYFYPTPVVIRNTPSCRTTTIRSGRPVIVAPIRPRVIITR